MFWRHELLAENLVDPLLPLQVTIMHRQRREAGIPRWRATLQCQGIIVLLRPRHRRDGIGFGLHAGAGLGEGSDVDARSVHFAEAHIVEVGQTNDQIRQDR